MQKSALVCGAGGFIGSHLVTRLRQDGLWVRGVDLNDPAFGASAANDFVIADLRDRAATRQIFDRSFDEVYQLAADMGGAGYIFTGEHDVEIMHNSASINLSVIEACQARPPKRLFFSSSACVYPKHNQTDPSNPQCAEASAYPADPDSAYGWEKIFAEQLYGALDALSPIACRIGRYHNIFGPCGTWRGGREKAPAALCRKVAEAPEGTHVDVWGDGAQTRSFLYIDECVEATLRLMRSDHAKPLNIGSEEMISINELARMVIAISGKRLDINNIDGPLGVRGRNSDNDLIRERLNWSPSQPLLTGMTETYKWVSRQVAGSQVSSAAG